MKIVRNLLFLLFAVYFAQGALYPSGSLLSQLCVFLVIIISMCFFIKELFIQDAKNPFFYAWTALLLLNIIGFIFTADYSKLYHTDMFKNILICMLSFYPFYFFAKKRILSESHLLVFLFIMLPITIVQFWYNELSLKDRFNIDDTGNVVNNYSYFFVMLMPYIFFIKGRKILSGIIMSIIILFIIQGSKRGAILSGAICLIFNFYYMLRTERKGNRINGYIISLLLIAFLSYYAYQNFLENDYLIYRMERMTEEGDVSGRDEIFDNIYNGWASDLSVIHFLFGYGFAGSLKFNGNYAHNDWLELLSNFGLLGIIVYLSLFYSSLKNFFNKNWDEGERIILLAISLTWLSISFYSMWYTSLFSFTHAIIFGYLFGRKNYIRLKK